MREKNPGNRLSTVLPRRKPEQQSLVQEVINRGIEWAVLDLKRDYFTWSVFGDVVGDDAAGDVIKEIMKQEAAKEGASVVSVFRGKEEVAVFWGNKEVA